MFTETHQGETHRDEDEWWHDKKYWLAGYPNGVYANIPAIIAEAKRRALETPMGVNTWMYHGKKYGYDKYFKIEWSDIPICPHCNKPMKNAYDSIQKKISEYLWSCECAPNIVLSRG
jgi:hypothetical protein